MNKLFFIIFTIILLLLGGSLASADTVNNYYCSEEFGADPTFGIAPRVLRESQGGTATSTYETGDILYSDADNSLTLLRRGNNDQVLTLAAGVPTWAASAGGGGGGASAWEQIFTSPNAITPTTSDTGIFVTNSSTIAANFRVDGSATTTGSFYVGANDLVVLDGGFVGIGIAVPSDLLHVQSGSAGAIAPDSSADDIVIEASGNGGMSIFSPDANIGRLMFGSASDDTGALLQWQHDQNLMTLGTSNASDELSLVTGVLTEAMRIDASQQVGIGSDPSSIFHISDGSNDLFQVTDEGTIGSASTTGFINIGTALGTQTLQGGDLLVGRNATITQYLETGVVTASNAGYAAGDLNVGGAFSADGNFSLFTVNETTIDGDGMNMPAGDAYQIAGNSVLDATTLGSLVVNSSLTSVGTIATGVWEGTTIAVDQGGTGATSLTDGGILLGSGTGAITALGVATNGQIPIGDGATDPVLATLTAGFGIGITNGAGSITIDQTGSGSNWEGIFGTDLTPTSSLAGIFVTASSTIHKLTMDNATVTDKLVVGTSILPAPTNTATFIGPVYIQGNSTSTGNHVQGTPGPLASQKACYKAMSSTDVFTFFYFNGATQVITLSSCEDTGSDSTTTFQLGQ